MLSFFDWPFISSSFSLLVLRNCFKEKGISWYKIKQVCGKFCLCLHITFFPYCKIQPGFRARPQVRLKFHWFHFSHKNLSIKKIFDQSARISLLLWGMGKDKNKIHHRRMASREVPSYTPLSHSQTHRIDLKVFMATSQVECEIFFGLENI